MQFFGSLVTLLAGFQLASAAVASVRVRSTLEARQPCLPQKPVVCSNTDDCTSHGLTDCATAGVCYYDC
ncbi:hypothetical protein LX36DRAFT_656589 [Colletotrichum falcatum]|nr:hypothetical protein LX36DRAFT_656589 [Colletotrichum falcatum]